MSVFKEFKIQSVETAPKNGKTFANAEQAFQGMLAASFDDSFYVLPSVDLDYLVVMLRELNIEVREGITGGCYGARDGSSYKGFTCYINYLSLPDTWVDSDGDEVANVFSHMSEFKHEPVTDEFFDSFKGQHRNTYNDDFNPDFDCQPSQYVDYKIHETEDTTTVVARFHNGGDIRGNYSSPILFEFDYVEDFLNCIVIPKQLTGE